MGRSTGIVDPTAKLSNRYRVVSNSSPGGTLRFRVIEPICPVLVTVVGPQVEVSDDLHLLGKNS